MQAKEGGPKLFVCFQSPLMAGLLALICFSDPVLVSKVSREANALIGRPHSRKTEIQ